MSVGKVVELTASHPKSFEEAIKSGLARAQKTLKNVQGAWVKEMKVSVGANGAIEAFRVNMQVTFLLEE